MNQFFTLILLAVVTFIFAILIFILDFYSISLALDLSLENLFPEHFDTNGKDSNQDSGQNDKNKSSKAFKFTMALFYALLMQVFYAKKVKDAFNPKHTKTPREKVKDVRMWFLYALLKLTILVLTLIAAFGFNFLESPEGVIKALLIALIIELGSWLLIDCFKKD